MDLFLVVLGGRIRGCHVEQHDVRWVVGATIEDTLPTLRQEWIGLRSGLHIDSYRLIKRVDGHRITVKTQPEPSSNTTKPLLWFVNLGAYTPRLMSEQHQFGLVVADSAIKAKHRARRRWLQGLEQVHKDDIHAVDVDPRLDDLLPIDGLGRWSIVLTPERSGDDPSEEPDWYGYWKI